ncbi:MAG TPA: threonine synthase, partial [Saprospiraceae bacterium]|nr:threonine synthase [Saprospiraceae bacterium]
NNDQKLTILVATSGDTGGAVAYGFLGVPGIEVIILYPSGKVSELQEKQLTTLGQNITACEIQGSFDDCQSLVKEAFTDADLNQKYRLSSANSINIARLIPQSFYYFEAYRQWTGSGKWVCSVPSGNFGNLTAGLMAKQMGLPIHHFVAATNVNKVVPDYLESGEYEPRASVSTLSNAMDVGQPSNFVRMMALYQQSWLSLKADLSGFWATDEETKVEMKRVFDNSGYVLDPHGAIGHLALRKYLETHGGSGFFLETAHPAKFLDTVEAALGQTIEIPERLAQLKDRKKEAVGLGSEFGPFKDFLLSR